MGLYALANATQLQIFQEEVYAPHGTEVHLRNEPSDNWGASIRTLLTVPTDSVVGLVGGTEMLVYATGNEVDYYNASVWARNTTNIKYLVFHKDLLWGIDVAGQLYYTDDLSTSWTADAKLQIPSGYVMGPDRDDGLPSERRGVISQILSSHNDLLVVLDASGSAGVSALAIRGSAGMGSSRQGTFSAGSGKSSILGWDQRGWEAKWAAATTGLAITSAVVGYAHSQYRLWWAYDKQVYYMNLPIDVVNPVQLPTQRYATGGSIEYPWFDAGVSNQEKLGLSVFIDSTHPSSSETIKIEYATDLDETNYTELATKTATGQSEYMLPSASDVTGKVFRYWKFKLTFARGGTNLNTPNLHKIYLVYRKRVGALWGATISVDISEDYNDVSPRQQLKNLEAARYSNPLVEAVWVDDDTNVQNYYVDVLQLQPIERGGIASPEAAIITIVEPRQSTDR